MKDGIRRSVVDRGQFSGGRRPYGYRHEVWLDDAGKRKSRLVPDPAEAAIVRRIFAEYVAGRAQNAIARDLQRERVATLTPTGAWYATTVRGILENPTHVGRVVLNGEDYPGTHSTIVDHDTWQQAVALRQGRHGQGRPRGRRTAGRHLLTEGLLRCTCGEAMSPVTKRDTRAANGWGYESYICVKRLHHGPPACAQMPLKRAAVDTAVYEYFETVALDLDSMHSTIAEQAAVRVAETAGLRAEAERDAAKAEASLARVERDYLDGNLAVEQWQRFEDQLTRERHAALAQMEQHDHQRDAIEAEVAAIDAEAEVVRRLAEVRRQVVGDVREAKAGELDGLRPLLRRLFVGFELASQTAPHGSLVLRGQGMVPSDDSEFLLDFGSFVLLPVLRWQAIDRERDDPAGFPAVQRLPLHSNLCARLAAW